MGEARGGSARQESAHGFRRIREDQRPRVHATQEDLQAPVAADVVEGAPHESLGWRPRSCGQ